MAYLFLSDEKLIFFGSSDCDFACASRCKKLHPLKQPRKRTAAVAAIAARPQA